MASLKSNDEHTEAFIECFHDFECLCNDQLESCHRKEVKGTALRSIALRMDANYDKKMTWVTNVVDTQRPHAY